MGESKDHSDQSRRQTRAARLVDSLRDNLKKLGGVRNASTKGIATKAAQHVFNGSGDNEGQMNRKSHRRKSSFELYLSTIPKLDPVDRTVGWVMMQLDTEASLWENQKQQPLSPKCSSVDVECETSISRCESERGTHGRGTPPVRDKGQPRLDELFRKLQMKQERDARKVISRQFDENSHNLNNFLASPLLRDFSANNQELLKTPQRPARLRADILHKNSFYYNQPAEAENTYLPKSVSEHCCGWKECRAKFLSSSDLLKHVQDDHLSYLPLKEYQCQRKLTCQWRKCMDNRSYPARYKLLVHLQRCHCNDKKHNDNTKEVSGQFVTQKEHVQPGQSAFPLEDDHWMEITEQLSENDYI